MVCPLNPISASGGGAAVPLCVCLPAKSRCTTWTVDCYTNTRVIATSGTTLLYSSYCYSILISASQLSTLLEPFQRSRP